MAYVPQYVNTTDFLTPSLWNHAQDGIYNGESNYVDVTVTTDANGYASLGATNGAVDKVINATVISPRRCACELWLNEVGDTYYRAFVYARGETRTAQASAECIIRVWKKN